MNNKITTGMPLGSGYLTSVLGRGGCATVFEIWNPKLEVKRAVKLVNPDIPEKLLSRFETEIKISAKFHHPNIIEIHNVGDWNGLPYIEMEIIDGESLREIIAQKGALPVEVATAIFILVCRALIYAHEQDLVLYGKQRKGILHCDIKPANIMITKKGVVKLTDFGLAIPTDASHVVDSEKFSGTFRYASPEQLKMMPVDERTDIYSLGVVMYEVYSGKQAFYGMELEQLVKNRMDDVYIPFEQHCPDINPAIKKIIKRNMAVNREERYASVRKLLADVEKVYSKLTRNSPEQVIADFFSDAEYTFSSRRYRKGKYLFPIISGMIVVIVSIIYFLLVRFPDTSGNEGKSTRHGEGMSIDDSLLLAAVGSKKDHVDDSTTERWELGPETNSKTTPTKPVSPSSSEILQQLCTVLSKKELKKAATLFRAHTLEDGEYYSLYAQYLAYTGSDSAALAYVEKGFKTPARRLSSLQRRLLYLSSKATCLTASFDRLKEKSKGEKAMAAWFEVKYLLKDQPNNVQYKHADAEIRRIHGKLQERVSTN